MPNKLTTAEERFIKNQRAFLDMFIQKELTLKNSTHFGKIDKLCTELEKLLPKEKASD